MKTLTIIILSSLVAIIFILSLSKRDQNQLIADKANSNRSEVNLVEFKDNSIETPHEFICDTCFLSIEFQSDTFIVKVITPSNCGESLGRIKKVKDTLLIYSCDKPDKVDTVIKFNEQTNRFDTTIILEFSLKAGPTHCMSILAYKVIGLNQKPTLIKFNDQILKECKSRESFLIQNNDTLNLTDRYGLQQGLWFEYFKSGTIKRKDNYINGFIRQGYEFNINGDTTLIRSNYGCQSFELNLTK